MSHDFVVDAIHKDFKRLDRATIVAVYKKTRGSVKTTCGVLERVEKTANAIKREFPDVSYDVIATSLRSNDFKVKQTQNELSTLRKLGTLRRKYPQVAPDVLALVWKDSGEQYKRADQALRDLTDQAKRTRTLRGKRSSERPTTKSNSLKTKSLSPRGAARETSNGAPPAAQSPYSTSSDFQQAIIATHMHESAPPPPAPIEILSEDDEAAAAAAADGAEGLGADVINLDAISFGAERARALYNYEPEREGRLPFRKGDIIDIESAPPESDWWRGTVNGKSGKFPRSYVRMTTSDILAKAIYAFSDSSREEHILFDVGDQMVLLNAVPNSQWWECIHLKTGKVGIAPTNYLTVEKNQQIFDDLNLA